MINLDYYVEKYHCQSAEEAFVIFLDSLRTYYPENYWVDWQKALQNISEIEYELALLATLCRKSDVRTAARKLLQTYPEIIRVLPVLMATRNKVEIATDSINGRFAKFEFNEFRRRNKKKLSPSNLSLFVAENPIEWNSEIVERYSEFLELSGILHLFEHVSNIKDYAFGVEVGLDSNARKNRSGKAGVTAFMPLVEQLIVKYPDLEFKSEVTTKVLKSCGLEVPVEFHKERWDLVIFNRLEQRRFLLIEINHYGGQGSKPNSIERDYRSRYQTLKSAGIEFLWITDGHGWHKLRNSLWAAFNSVNVSTIKLAREGYLEYCLNNFLNQSSH